VHLVIPAKTGCRERAGLLRGQVLRIEHGPVHEPGSEWNCILQSVNPQSWNLYSYVLNNPLSAVDPDGRECVWDNGSFDSATDAHTGSVGGCQAAGGTYYEPYEPSTFTAGNGQDWSAAPNAELAAQVAAGKL